ncbi:CoA-binding protein [Lactococcus cremoris]|uniref:CoA-binding protein n=4 Tax=Lactococcus lactis subsp. cremoris TaxID=1359 RepID=A0A1V0PJW1_LACLC|nr:MULTISPECIES: CoA-binding protein [Lactococcus]ARD90482.2 CoA-binding protein [Lactococcus cremoris]ARE17261.2 CoA-binding protein [Lactococcus cremoris]ARE22376.2 CoA-binding protein [Lactococcus cremoris]ARE25009.2 CoA-binding protein [Lactococcus cremoris]ARE29561.2 CoA-binding protein [Lactococcus cremoris]
MMYEFENPEQEVLFDYLKKAKTIAVVGISDKTDRSSYLIAQGLQKNGYRVIPVNPRLAGTELLGEKVFSTIKDIPFHIDIVDIFRRSEFLADVARDFIETDADVFWAQLGLQSQEAEQILRTAGKSKIVMNRCIKIEYAYSGLGRK